MPTTRGWLVAAAGVLLLAGGILSQYQELALLGALAVLAVITAALSVGRPAAVTVTRSLPMGTRSAPGRSVRVHMSAHNTGRRALRISERVVGPDGSHDVALPALPGHGTGGSDYWVQSNRRGLIELGPLSAGRSDPLGLARSTRAHGGLGIGLTLVRRLVEMHGGQVSASSPGKGLGSTFTIRLPAAAAARREVA